jgi:hypothetical protein
MDDNECMRRALIELRSSIESETDDSITAAMILDEVNEVIDNINNKLVTKYAKEIYYEAINTVGVQIFDAYFNVLLSGAVCRCGACGFRCGFSRASDTNGGGKRCDWLVLLLVSILLLFLQVLTICVVPILIAYVYTPTRFLDSPVINDPHLDEIREDIVTKLRNSHVYKADARLIEYFIKCLAVTQPGDNPRISCVCALYKPVVVALAVWAGAPHSKVSKIRIKTAAPLRFFTL